MPDYEEKSPWMTEETLQEINLSREDMRLMARAIRNGWRATEDFKKELLETLARQMRSDKPRISQRAMELVVTLEAQNIQNDRHFAELLEKEHARIGGQTQGSWDLASATPEEMAMIDMLSRKFGQQRPVGQTVLMLPEAAVPEDDDQDEEPSDEEYGEPVGEARAAEATEQPLPKTLQRGPTERAIIEASPIINVIGEIIDLTPLEAVPNISMGDCPLCGSPGVLRADSASGRFLCGPASGCGRRGDVVDFVAAVQAVSRAEALDMLAQRAGL